VADVFGDWREELLVRTEDSEAIRIYLATEVTDMALTTLMHDVQYRAEVARQQTAYNQPSWTSYYLASDMDVRDVPTPAVWLPGALDDLEAALDEASEAGEVDRPCASQLGRAVPGAHNTLVARQLWHAFQSASR